MASALITTLTVTTPFTDARPVPVSDSEHNGFLQGPDHSPGPVTPAGSVTRCCRCRPTLLEAYDRG